MIKKHGGNVYKFSKEHKIAIDDIVDFSANINPLGLSDKVHENLENIFKNVLNYPDPNYSELNEAIAKFEDIEGDHLVIGNGAIECIFLLAEHLKAGHVMIPQPTFVEYERAFSKYQTKISYFQMDKMLLDVDDLIRNLNGVDVLVICNPNNPTGSLVEKSDLIRLLEYTKENEIIFVLDEAFIDFTDKEDENTMKSFVNTHDHLVILKSLTKFFAIPGLRLGYLMTSNKELLENISSHRMPWSINCIASQVGVLVLEDHDYINQTKEWIVKERQWFFNQLLTIEGIFPYNSQGNYIFFKSDISDLDIRLAPKGIMIRNCSNYEGLDVGYFRVAIKDRFLNEQLITYIKEILWKS